MAQWRNLCLAVLMFLAVNIHEIRSDDDENYSILIDAGSSSSKVKIYSWTHQKNLNSVPEVHYISSRKVTPEITSFVNDFTGLEGYIKDCLDAQNLNEIPLSKQRLTPVFVMATAGMRFLEADITKQLMENIRTILKNRTINPFAPLASPTDVGVLSGEEEGVFSWIAANYLHDFFTSEGPVNETVGVLEMGGGSTQIAFIPEGPLYDGEFQIKLANRRFSLYVHSYLDFGVNGIAREIVAQLAKEQQSTSQVYNPCILQGDTKWDIVNGNNVTSIGQGSAQSCREVLNEIMSPAEGIMCQPKPCAIRQVYQPSVGVGSFYATEAFAYATNALKAVGSNDTINLIKLNETAYTYCGLNLPQALENQGGGSTKYLSGYCTAGVYFRVLFEHYGFSLDTQKIRLKSKIGDEKLNWALGAMVVRLSDKFGTPGAVSVTCPTKRPAPNSGSKRSVDLDSLMSQVVFVLASMVAGRYASWD